MTTNKQSAQAVNDPSFHLEASQRLGESIAHGEPLMDPWVSQWSLGFPLWRVYQPLPHLLAAVVIALARPFASPAASFAALYYVLLVLMPVAGHKKSRVVRGCFGFCRRDFNCIGDLLDRTSIGVENEI